MSQPISQRLRLWLVAVQFALTSLWREARSSLIVRSLCITAAFGLCAFLILNGNLRQAVWSSSVALLGIAALSLSGLSLHLRKRREMLAPLLLSMPVGKRVWQGCDVIALITVTACLSVPFLAFLYLIGVASLGVVTTLALCQMGLITILSQLGASGKAGSVAWSVIVVVIWAQLLHLFKANFY